MKNYYSLLIILLLILSVWGCDKPFLWNVKENKKQKQCAIKSEQKVWSKEKANQWYEKNGWMAGCNFIPSTAINQLEMWQAETWDAETIDRELGIAEAIGFNLMRVYLHYLPWQQNSKGFKQRIQEYLDIADKHGIKTMFVLFDDCWYGNPQSGKQPEPVPGFHNSGWVQCPRYAEVMDTTIYPELEEYTKGILSSFGNDDRVVVWDLYNEPANNHEPEQILPLLKKVVQWARAVNPKQPITIGVWRKKPSFREINTFQLKNSDVISFHNYGSYESMKKDIANYQSFQRPVFCTEYIARSFGSKFQTHLPLLKEYKVSAINWGLVYGKTQTIFPWGSPLNGDEPEVWHHDIFRKDGTPYDTSEIAVIKQVMGVEK